MMKAAIFGACFLGSLAAVCALALRLLGIRPTAFRVTLGGADKVGGGRPRSGGRDTTLAALSISADLREVSPGGAAAVCPSDSDEFGVSVRPVGGAFEFFVHAPGARAEAVERAFAESDVACQQERGGLPFWRGDTLDFAASVGEEGERLDALVRRLLVAIGVDDEEVVRVTTT